MIHFSSSVNKALTISIPCGGWFTDAKLVQFFCQSNGFRNSKGLQTPAEERVVDNFRSWVFIANQKSTACDGPGAFVYVNMNTGRTVVYVASYNSGGDSTSNLFWDIANQELSHQLETTGSYDPVGPNGHASARRRDLSVLESVKSPWSDDLSPDMINRLGLDTLMFRE